MLSDPASRALYNASLHFTSPDSSKFNASHTNRAYHNSSYSGFHDLEEQINQMRRHQREYEERLKMHYSHSKMTNTIYDEFMKKKRTSPVDSFFGTAWSGRTEQAKPFHMNTTSFWTELFEEFSKPNEWDGKMDNLPPKFTIAEKVEKHKGSKKNMEVFQNIPHLNKRIQIGTIINHAKHSYLEFCDVNGKVFAKAYRDAYETQDSIFVRSAEGNMMGTITSEYYTLPWMGSLYSQLSRYFYKKRTIKDTTKQKELKFPYIRGIMYKRSSWSPSSYDGTPNELQFDYKINPDIWQATVSHKSDVHPFLMMMTSAYDIIDKRKRVIEWEESKETTWKFIEATFGRLKSRFMLLKTKLLN